MSSTSNFSLRLTQLANAYKDRADTVVRKVVLDVSTRLVERSPVGQPELWARNRERAKRGLPPLPKGYIGGHFRANWQYAFSDYSSDKTIEGVDPTGSKTIARIASELPRVTIGKRHVIYNNLPYALELENGHSTQAPHGMVGLTVIEFRSVVQAAIAAARETPNVFRSNRD